MKLHPRVTKTTVELVERFEGLRRKAARLPDGGWTIGYGHTLTAREGGEVNEEEAELLLYYDLSEVATKVEAWTFTPLNQNQFEALTAFAFNIGVENFRRSTVLKRVNEGQHLQAAAAMELWRKTEVDGEGLVADALVRRRAAEKAHYLTPPEGFRPSPSQVLKPVFDFSVIEAAAQSHLANRAMIIDAPMEGAHAVAMVEPMAHRPAAPHGGEATAGELHPAAHEPAAEHLPVAPMDLAAPVAAVAALVAVASTPEMVHAPTPASAPAEEPLLTAEPEPAQLEAHPLDAPEGEASSLEAPPFTGPSPANAFEFRNFEPPPRRFNTDADLAPAPTAHEPAAESVERQAEPVPEFNLFDRPLAPPQPAAAPVLADGQTAARTLRLRDDHLDADGPPSAVPPMNGRGVGALRDRTVLFSSVGLLGVVMFAATIATMLFGKATLAHLLVGLFGVVLITLAGVFFLLQHHANGHGHADHLAETPGEAGAELAPEPHSPLE